MELNRKKRTIKYFCYAVIILLADLLQNTPGLFPEIFGAKCFLLIPVTIFLSGSEDFFAGALLGLFGGLLWDLNASVHIGFNCIFLTLFCFICSALITYIARDIFITNFIVSTAASILYSIAYWLSFIVIKGVDGGYDTLFSFYIPCIIYTIVISVFAWLALKPIKKKLNKTN
ncbi:MAG: hypothetical protein NC213_04810 [Acetobacter sp.]|nr:hypothetical protein [Bacteroides sp.]MCM1341046.1 hypothetical protein [Acetobacter sp.]MCM1432398.1 hypothetical protein [Clostridiales bacterium]